MTPAEIIQATLVIYRDCARDATNAMRKNWLIVVSSIALFVGFLLMSSALMVLGWVGGVLVSIAALVALSLYYRWLDEVVGRQRLRWTDLWHFDAGTFFALVSVSFVLWLVQWVAGTLIAGLGADWVLGFLGIGFVVLLNALPEVIYLKRAESLQAMEEAFRFTYQNWIEWYLPFVIITLPFLWGGVDRFTLGLASMSPLLPVSMVFMAPGHMLTEGTGLLWPLLGVVLANWFMIFRGFLFRALDGGTRRQRAFVARQK